jgi:hypothetical protein
MEMENEMNEPSYWPSVFLAGVIVAFIMSALGLGSGYMTLGSEPTGETFSAASFLGILVCLIAGIAGIIATRHYAREHDVTFPIGRGALIGFLSGVTAVTISTLVGLLWTAVIDPNMNQALYDWQIMNMEAANMTEEQIEMTLKFTPKPGSMMAVLSQFGIGLVVIGIFNLLTGMIGAKVFASEE